MSFQPEIDRKHCEEVFEWLRATLQSDDISFEVNPQTVGMLYSKMKQSETATQCDQNMLRALADAKAEYRAETDRIQTVLGKFGISTGEKFLSKSGLTSLAHLSGVANHLELNEVSIGTYLAALQDQEDLEDNLQLQTLRQRTQKERLEIQLGDVNSKLEQIDSQFELFEATRVNCHQVLTDKEFKLENYYGPKCAQYRAKMKKQQAELSHKGFVPQLDHRVLVELGNNVSSIDDKVAKLQAKKLGFQNLPPDIGLAQVEVERSRMQLAALKEQLGNLMELESETINPR